MNPCRCGYYPDRKKCSCTPVQVKNYLDRISRPFLDRIDICVETVPLRYNEVGGNNSVKGEMSADIRKRVEEAHKIQRDRYNGTDILLKSIVLWSQKQKITWKTYLEVCHLVQGLIIKY